MSVDIFGRTNVENTQKVFSAGVTLTQINNEFLRRDGGNTATDSIDMGSHKIVNAAEPTDLQDVATKNYVDSKAVVSKSGDTMTGELNMNNNKITHLPIRPTDKLEATSKVYVDGQDYKRVSKAGDVMTGNLKLNIAGSADSVRSLGCSDLTAGKSFQLLLVNIENQLDFSLPHASATKPTVSTPVTLQTSAGLLVKTNGDDVCRLSTPEIMIYEDVDINGHKLKNLQSPVNDQDAATKHYVDNLKGPAFNAGNTVPQNLRVNEKQKITFNAKLIDTDDKFSIPFSRLQPGKAGYYQVNANVIFNSVDKNYYGNVYLYKNNNPFLQIGGGGSNGASFVCISGNTLVRLSSNDYIELVALCTQNINITANEFSAIFIRN